jgi:hypothetical protein
MLAKQKCDEHLKVQEGNQLSVENTFGGVLIANEGFNQETAQQVIAVGGADAVSIEGVNNFV